MIELTVTSRAKGIARSSSFCNSGLILISSPVKPNAVQLQAMEMPYTHLPKDKAAGVPIPRSAWRLQTVSKQPHIYKHTLCSPKQLEHSLSQHLSKH